MAPWLSAAWQHESRKEHREVLMRVEWQQMGDSRLGKSAVIGLNFDV